MTINRINLPMTLLLKEKESYDVLSRKISTISIPYTIRQVEGSTFGEPCISPRELEELIRNCKNELDELDIIKPLYEQNEPGKHFAYELFFEDPPTWGSRGAPFMWAYCARQFSNDKLPMDTNRLQDKYLNLFLEFGIPIDGEESTYIDRFAWSGMSSGFVGGYFAKESLKTLILRHNQLVKYASQMD